MVEDNFDNSEYGIHSYEAIELIKQFFNSNLPQFELIESYAESPYWGVRYSFKNLSISIIGDVGYGITISIDGKEFPLWQYDRTVNNAMKTNKKNILYQLNVLNRFLSEIHLE